MPDAKGNMVSLAQPPATERQFAKDRDRQYSMAALPFVEEALDRLFAAGQIDETQRDVE
jgi:hypothetical protein